MDRGLRLPWLEDVCPSLLPRTFSSPLHLSAPPSPSPTRLSPLRSPARYTKTNRQVAARKKWDNIKIVEHFWQRHASKLLAFHMGMHTRLGKDGDFHLLAGMRDVLELISCSFWGSLPLESSKGGSGYIGLNVPASYSSGGIT